MKKLFVTLLFAGFISFIPSSLHFTITFNLSAQIPSDGLVAWYPFNGNANDESGNGNHGTVNGATLISDRNGITSGAFNFNGIDQFISVPHNDQFNFVNEYSISLWFTVTDYVSHHTFINKNNTGCGCNDPFNIETLHAGYYHPAVISVFEVNVGEGALLAQWGNGSSSEGLLYNSAPTTGDWHNVIVTVGNNSRMYLDGVLVQEYSKTLDLIQNQLPISIGAWQGTGIFHSGKLDDIAIYNRSLTTPEIQQLYQDQTGQIQVPPSCSISATSSSFCSGEIAEFTFSDPSLEIPISNPMPYIRMNVPGVYVGPNGSDLNGNGTLSYPYKTVQYAISMATNGQSVNLLSGVYTGTGNTNLSLQGKSIVLQSVNGPGVTIIDGQNTTNGFLLNQGETVSSIIRGVTIQNCIPTTKGSSAIFVEDNSGVAIRNCVFKSNSSNNISTASVVQFGDNEVSGPNSSIDSCIFFQNNSRCIYSSKKSWYARNCLFEQNSFSGVFIGNGHDSGDDQDISNCVFRNNTLTGGTFVILGHAKKLENCFFIDNVSTDRGLVYMGTVWSGTNLVNHCTFYNNSAVSFNSNTFDHLGQVKNSVFYGSTGLQIISGKQASIPFTNCNGNVPSGAGNNSVDPLFVNPALNQFGYAVGSSCIGSADDGGNIGANGNSIPTWLWSYSGTAVSNNSPVYNWSNQANGPSAQFDLSSSETITCTVTQGDYSCTASVDITVNPAITNAVSATILEGQSYALGTQTLTTAGTYTEVFTSAAGCDSTVTLTLAVEPALSCEINTSNRTICNGGSVILEVASLGSSNSLINNFAITNGEVTLPSPILNDDSEFTINAFLKVPNFTATTSNVYKQVIGGEVVLRVEPNQVVFQVKASYGNCYTASGWVYIYAPIQDSNYHKYSAIYNRNVGYIQLYKDDVLVSSQTVNNGSLANCNAYSAAVGVLNSSIFIDEISIFDYAFNSSEVESIHLNDLMGTESGLRALWKFNEGTGAQIFDYGPYSFNGSFNGEFVVQGQSILIDSNGYAWSTNETTPTITVSPTQNTTYSCTVTQGNQTCTTSVDITVNPNVTNVISATIIEGETYTLGAQTLTTAGTYTEVFTSAAGCDSTVTLTLSVSPPPLTCEITAPTTTLCEGESVILTNNNIGINSSSTYSQLGISSSDFPMIMTSSMLLVPSQYANLQLAINSAANGDTIAISPGIYYWNNISLQGKEIKIIGLEGPEVTVIDGNNSSRIFSCISGETFNSEINGLTIRNGRHDTGSALYVINNSYCTIKNCKILNNSAIGIWTRPAISIGHAYNNGPHSPSSIHISNCYFSGNTAYYGACVFNEESGNTPMIIENSIFEDNTSFHAPGVFGTRNGIIRNCVFRNNTANSGAAGAAVIQNEGGNPLIQNCTFLNNSAYAIGRNSVSAVTYIKNCISWGNTGFLVEHNPSMFQVSYCTIQGGYADNLSSNPNFIDDQGRIDSSSPCYNAGDPSMLDGDGSVSDIGAYRYLSNSNTSWSTNATTPTITVTPTQNTTYTCTVTQGNQTCTASVDITVNPNVTNAISASIIEGETYTLGTQTLTTAGTYTEVFSSTTGCDSTVTLILAVEPLLTCEITGPATTLCEGDLEFLTLSTSYDVDSIQGMNYLGELGSSRYYMSELPSSWSNAKIISEQLGGHLVTIGDIQENQFILSKIGLKYVYIGLYQDLLSADYSEPSGGWKWVTGESLDYLNWQPGVPNNGLTDNVAHMYSYASNNPGEWNDVNGGCIINCADGQSMYFIVEVPSASASQLNLLWSNNATTPNITVSPTQTTTYTATVTTATQTCTDSITITVNPLFTWFADADADGFGNPDDVVQDCNQPLGYIADNTDCNDEDAATYPGAAEICDNNRDENCDGVDSLCFVAILGCTDVNACNFNPEANTEDNSCILPQPETCNGLDDNCNGQIDEGLSAAAINAVSATTALYPVCSGNSIRPANLNNGANSAVIDGNSNDLWFSINAQFNTLRAGLSAATGDNDVRLYTIGSTGCLELIETEHETTNGNQTLLSDQLTVGQTYYVAVHNISGPMNASAKICFNHLTGSTCDHYYSNNTGIYPSVCASFKAQYRANAVAYTFDILSATQNNVNQNITPWSYTTTSASTVVARLGALLPANQGTAPMVYTLKVPVLYSLFDAAGNFENLFAQATTNCTVTLNAEPTIALRSSDRCPTNKSLTSTIAPDRTVCGAMRYDWEFTEVLPNPSTAQVVQGGNYTTVFFLSNVPGITAGKTYNVRVRPVHSSGITGNWGAAQCLRVGAAGMMNHPGSADAEPPLLSLRAGGEMNASISIYPNPTSTGSFVLQYNGPRRGELTFAPDATTGRTFAQESMTESESAQELIMMDITGKVVFKTNVVLNGNIAEIHFGDLESGLYLVDFGGERSRLQVVK